MWVWYRPWDKFGVYAYTFPNPMEGSASFGPSGCCMMIPGTYAQMLEDYD